MNAEDTVVHACRCRVIWKCACVCYRPYRRGLCYTYLVLWKKISTHPLVATNIYYRTWSYNRNLFWNQSTSKQSFIIVSFYSAHEVVIEKIEIASSCLTSSLPDNILGYKEAMANGDRYYIAARFERDKEQVPRKFVVGDGEIYGGYINAPRESSCKTDYKAYVKAATEVNGVSLREHS